ncbi:hypothetical protein FOYG_16983 [Fusarium oxysporum NRRL 32931]|uniref:RNase III domain-containing protein n=1 Tax=Fusarium oxysporum NRRL 32931 TaxID=660029 RepID=W9HG05_FUSOX|nr:hypothetical protein FOYG_16983 [Fusarium oxysporum NRRL 32931]
MDFSSGFGPKVSQCEAIIGYCFNSKVLCAEALNAAADSKSVYILDGLLHRMPKNDRLAVYGDSAAAFYLCSVWVQRGLDKHCWTMLRHDLISNENLARVGMEHGLDTCINVNGGTVRVTPGMVATAVEAILGAVERDGGHGTLARVMAHLGLTQHALLSLVTFCLLTHLLHVCRSAASYSLDLLGPSVAALGPPFVRALWAWYAIEWYLPA